MSGVDTTELRKLAEAATPGPWRWEGRISTLIGRAGDPETYVYDAEVIEAEHYGECGCRSACTLDLIVKQVDADYIAAVSPDTVIALLDKLEALTKDMHARELHHFESEELLAVAEGKITRALEAHAAKHGQRAVYNDTALYVGTDRYRWEEYVTCAACSADWPCATVRILTEGDPK